MRSSDATGARGAFRE